MFSSREFASAIFNRNEIILLKELDERTLGGEGLKSTAALAALHQRELDLAVVELSDVSTTAVLGLNRLDLLNLRKYRERLKEKFLICVIFRLLPER